MVLVIADSGPHACRSSAGPVRRPIRALLLMSLVRQARMQCACPQLSPWLNRESPPFPLDHVRLTAITVAWTAQPHGRAPKPHRESLQRCPYRGTPHLSACVPWVSRALSHGAPLGNHPLLTSQDTSGGNTAGHALAWPLYASPFPHPHPMRSQPLEIKISDGWHARMFRGRAGSWRVQVGTRWADSAQSDCVRTRCVPRRAYVPRVPIRWVHVSRAAGSPAL